MKNAQSQDDMDEMLLPGAQVSLTTGDDPGERHVLFPDLRRSFDRASWNVFQAICICLGLGG